MECRLAIFLPRGTSLRSWDESGILEHEMALYKSLSSLLPSVFVVSYGNGDAEYASRMDGVEILCNPGLPAAEYEQSLLDVHADRLAKADLFQGQDAGVAAPAVEAARRFEGISLARCGLPGSAAVEPEERTALLDADCIIVPTEAAKRFVVAAYGTAVEKIAVIPDCVCTETFSPGDPAAVAPEYASLYEAVLGSGGIAPDGQGADGPSLERMSWGEQAEFLADSAIACARGHDPDTALRLLFEIDKRIYREEGFLAIRYDGGVHTKHRHIAYHTYFTERVRPGERVLDVGCGNGLLSMQVAAAGAHVTAMEQHADIVADAKKRHSHERVTFLTGDVLYDLPEEPFDTIILSNILEHIEERVEFLEMLTKRYTPGRFLMRVPRYDRDWRVPLKDEMGVDYFLDPTHYTEYTPEAFERELEQAGLHIVSGETRWGEIWAEVARKETTAGRDHGREREGL
jgi:SAM-dependent methyltransferase